MKRPYSANCKPEPTAYRPEVAAALREHFQMGLDIAIKQVAAGSREAVIFPTVANFCRSRGLSLHTVYTWRRADRPGIRDAMVFAGQVRCQIANLSEAHGLKLIFDGEAGA